MVRFNLVVTGVIGSEALQKARQELDARTRIALARVLLPQPQSELPRGHYLGWKAITIRDR
jgi:hypothetical protein